MSQDRIITFLSDFGTREYYTGAVKGSILCINPTARIIDLSHEIPSHDLLSAAFTIFGAYSTYPQHTIHLVVVDPGVGSNRKGIIVSTENGIFVAPDNGVLSLVFRAEQSKRVVAIDAEHYYRRPVSPTFHGRDIFGPVAGWLSRGIELSNFGPTITDPVQLGLPATRETAADTVEGFVLHIDKFGNIITSISEADVKNWFSRGQSIRGFSLNEKTVSRQVTCYAEGGDEELFYLLGSAGFYEISAKKQPASRLLGAKRGMRVRVSLANRTR